MPVISTRQFLAFSRHRDNCTRLNNAASGLRGILHLTALSLGHLVKTSGIDSGFFVAHRRRAVKKWNVPKQNLPLLHNSKVPVFPGCHRSGFGSRHIHFSPTRFSTFSAIKPTFSGLRSGTRFQFFKITIQKSPGEPGQVGGGA